MDSSLHSPRKKEKVAKNESAWNRVKTASALMERASAQKDLAASTVQKKHARIIAQNMARKYLIKIWPLPALHSIFIRIEETVLRDCSSIVIKIRVNSRVGCKYIFRVRGGHHAAWCGLLVDKMWHGRYVELRWHRTWVLIGLHDEILRIICWLGLNLCGKN